MLTVELNHRSTETKEIMMLILSIDDHPFHKFEWPYMYTKNLLKMIEGKDTQDQNDEGFFVTLKDGTFDIVCEPNSDVYEASTYTLSHDQLEEVLKEMLPIYRKIDEKIGQEYSDSD